MRNNKLATILMAGAVAATLVACGDDDTTTTTNGAGGNATTSSTASGMGGMGGMGGNASTTAGGMGGSSGDWDASCASDGDCTGATNFCVKQPNSPTGYCSIQCTATSVCTMAGAPADWTCNAVDCTIPAFTWCGPKSEIGMGPIKECK